MTRPGSDHAGGRVLARLQLAREPLADALPPAARRPPHALVTGELVWAQRYFTSWIACRLRGRS